MSIQTSLKDRTINLFSLIKRFKKTQITKDLDAIIKNDFEELNRDETYNKNFLELVSYIYANEQLQKQKSTKSDSLHIDLFDEEFISRLELLRNNYVHNHNLS